MTKQEFIDWALDHDWILEPGKLIRDEKTATNVFGTYRIKLHETFMSYEVSYYPSVWGSWVVPGRWPEWEQLKSEFYFNLSVGPDGMLVGVK